MTGKTITTYLIDGTPKGLQECWLSNTVCKAITIPRFRLKEANNRSELTQPSLYLLVDNDNQKAYIGETENFLARIKTHDTTKSFWDQAIVFISKDHNLTKSDIKYLEHKAIKQAQTAKRYNIDENKNQPNKPHLPEHQQATIDTFFNDICTLTAFMGMSIFENVHKKENQMMFYCKGRDTNAKGFYHENDFTVIKGGRMGKTSAPSYKRTEQRHQTLSEKANSINESQYELRENITFSSPSTASGFCLGRSTNGWITWKNKEGQTLNEVYRQE